MNVQSEEFASLLGLARRQSPAKRRLLFPLVIDLLCVGSPEMSGAEAQAMAAHISAFLDDVPPENAQRAITGLAQSPMPLVALLRALALLRPLFSAPIVSHAGILKDSDLVSLSRYAVQNSGLLRAFAERADLPPPALANIFWHLDAKEQEAALIRAVEASDEAFDAAKIRTPIRTADEAAQAIFVDDVRAGRFNQAAAFLASLAGITESCAASVLRDESCQTLAVVARACRLSKSTYSTLALLMHPACDDHVTNAQERISFFDNLDAACAWGALRLLRICRYQNSIEDETTASQGLGAAG